MIYLFMALRIEAEPWLKEPGWKPVESRFPSYEKDNVLLTITGTGPLSAAAAVSSILTAHDPHPEDVLIQCGIAAGVRKAELGRVYRIHKVTDFNSHRDYYPDDLPQDGLPEASLISASRIYHPDSITDAELEPFLFSPTEEPVLFDMEAAGVMDAAAAFLGPHQITCMKIVSDTGTAISKEEASRFSLILQENVDQRINEIRKRPPIPLIPKPDCSGLSRQLHCSLTMERQLSQLLYYCELAGIDWKSKIRMYETNGRLPTADRNEGKQILEELRHDLLG